MVKKNCGFNQIEMDLTEYYFEKVSQEDIFSIVFGKVDFNSYVTNPLREDKTPGAWFEWKDGILYFKDFAWGTKPLNSIEFLQEYFKLPLKDIYQIIEDILILKTKEPENLQIKTGKRKKRNNSTKTEIYFLPDEFKSNDKKYWMQYKLSKTFLEREDVFPTNKFIIVRENYKEIHSTNRCYAYSFYPCVKIYCPFSKNMKFITNCDNNIIGGKAKFKDNKVLVITKSFKDYGVLSNLGMNVRWFQNEGMLPNFDKLTFLHDFKKVIIFYDNDEPGIAASKRISATLSSFLGKKVYTYHLPKKYLKIGIKDPSDYVRIFGYKKLRKEIGYVR